MTDSELPPGPPRVKPPRLESLDVFRGITIAGMILVNNPGSSSAYAPLHHADWDGWTPTDLVFPSFLFIMGVAIPFSFAGGRGLGAGRAGLFLKIVRRSLVIFGIGLALQALGMILTGGRGADWSRFRIPGVLQRIALCYLAAAAIELAAGVRAKVGIIVALLVGYWLAMTMIRVPGHEPGDLSRAGNLAAVIDRATLGTHIYRPGVYDPEGILSTIPAVATTLIGILAGHWLRSGRSPFEKDAGLFLAGWFGVALGEVWGAVFPINKALWTSSYVLLAAGLALQALGVCFWIIDLAGHRRWSRPFAIFGKNAIAAYVVAALLARFLGLARWSDEAGRLVTAKGWFVETLLRAGLGPKNASLAFALVFVAICFVPIYAMDRKGVHLKA